MKKIVCELCESTEFAKDGGMFICQGCGTKYTLEEAKGMMREVDGEAPSHVTATVTSPVVSNNSAVIENYLSMARNALESSNNEEAENYANKIIELDYSNSDAWLIKGEAAGWQSRANNSRLSESISAWINAINYAAEEDKDDVRGKVASEYCRLFIALLSLHTGNFAALRSDDNLNAVIKTVDVGILMMNDLTVKGGVYFNRAPVYDEIAQKLNTAAVDGFENAKKDFGPEHINMSRYAWNNFTNACDNCLTLLDKAVEYVRSNSTGKTLCKNMVVIGETCRDSCSYKFDVNSWTYDHYVQDYSFTSGAKQTRTNNINVSKNWSKFFENSPYDAVLGKLSDERKDSEIELGKKAYWEEHEEEKQELENEKAALLTRVGELNKELSALPILTSINEIKSKISALNNEKNGLGLFKQKEKKAVQLQIDEQETTLRKLSAEADDQKKPLETEITNCQKRIREIDNEFNKERGRASTIGTLAIKDAVKDGKLTITPEQLVEHLEDKLPKEYEFEDLDSFDCSLHRDYDDCWAVIVGHKQHGRAGLLLIMQAESTSDPIKSIIVQTCCDRDVDDIALWCHLCANVIMTIFGEISRDTAEIVAAKMMLDNEQSRFFQDGLCVEYVSYVLELEDEDLKLKSMLLR